MSTATITRGNATRSERKRRYLSRMVTMRMEGLQLYQPLPAAEEFHCSAKKIRICRGSNRSSKTLSGAAEFARAVCGLDPFDKFVASGQGLVVSEDMDHLGELWSKLTEPGELKMIRDGRTNLFRAVRFDRDDPLHLDPYDEAYREKWLDAPPIIPSRLYHEPSWEDRGRGIPRLVRFKTGWKVLFRSSEGKPQKGAHYNLVWFDEQLNNEQFFVEARRGLVALNEPPRHIPRMWWTATPQITNPQLQDLDESAAGGASHVDSFKFLIKDNPYIPDPEKQAFFDDIPPDERLARWEGEFALSGRRIYAFYQPMGAHGCNAFPLDPDWTRYFVVDPGTDKCATLFAAVPPDESQVFIYDGFVVNQSNTQKWAAEVAKRNTGYAFEAAVIDKRAGRQHQMGLSISSTAEEYWQALIEAGVTIRTQGATKSLGGFFPGSDNVEAREQHLASQWMQKRGYGPFANTCKLQIFRGVIPELDHQIKRAHYDPKTGKRAGKNKVGAHDLLDALEYIAAFEPGYHPPERVLVGTIRQKPLTPVEHYRRKHPHQSLNLGEIEIG